MHVCGDHASCARPKLTTSCTEELASLGLGGFSAGYDVFRMYGTLISTNPIRALI